MRSLCGEETPPQVSSEQQAAAELTKRIRKLRWVGMEDEARALQHALAGARRAPNGLASPNDSN